MIGSKKTTNRKYFFCLLFFVVRIDIDWGKGDEMTKGNSYRSDVGRYVIDVNPRKKNPTKLKNLFVGCCQKVY